MFRFGSAPEVETRRRKEVSHHPMELRLYDTLTREKRPFTPLDPARVRMYVCGPTVYDFAHIGNARPVIVFDMLFRLLRYLAKQGVWDRGKGETAVTYVRNITDVDDKINARAAQEYRELPLNEAIRIVTEKTERQFHEDVAALGCLPPTIEPRATEHIEAMKTLIERLVAEGHAYVAEAHVLFSVPSMPDYGKLSKRSLDEMIAGARVEVAPYKRDPRDFVLWKPSKPGEPAWPSPAGIAAAGRPGWHIECSAMSWQHLGETFDIHGGGIDLVFPHHENEIAQSRCAFHTPVMATYWMHNGFLQVEGEKMAKSEGNFFTIRELLEKWPGDVLRLQMLMTHYRQPLDWTENRATLASSELEEWGHVLQNRYHLQNDKKPNAVIEALSDDLNTPNAISALRDLFSRAKKGGLDQELEFASACKFLGFRELNRPGLFRFGVSALNVGQHDLFQYSAAVQRLRAAIANDAPEAVRSELTSSIRRDGLDVEIARNGAITLVRGNQKVLTVKVNRLIKYRRAARERKDWAEADRIRDELKAMGIEFEDKKDGATVWMNRPDTPPLWRDPVVIAIGIAVVAATIAIALVLNYYLW
jgi:cysteinyl-tRNA synthetase